MSLGSERDQTFRKLSNIKIHVDDAGASETISKIYVDLIRNKQIQGCSVLATGTGLETFIAELRKLPISVRRKVSYSIHLDLCEGIPISKIVNSRLISKKTGKFQSGFIFLFIELILSNRNRRSRLISEITEEWRAQIEYLNSSFEKLIEFEGLDSHRHFHVMPYIFPVAKKLSEDYNLDLRLPIEKIHCEEFFSIFSIHFLTGLLKSVLIRMFLRREKPCTNFIGVLYSGKMSVKNVITGIHKITQENNPQEVLTTVLFHPGQDIAYVDSINTGRLFKNWYSSVDRKKELQELIKLGHILSN